MRADGLLLVGHQNGDTVGMEQEAEIIRLGRQIASIDATLQGFAKDVNRRLDAQGREIAAIRETSQETLLQATKTNGRVGQHEARIQDLTNELVHVKTNVSSLGQKLGEQRETGLTLPKLRWYLACLCAGFVLCFSFVTLIGWGPASTPPSTPGKTGIDTEAKQMLEDLKRQVDLLRAEAAGRPRTGSAGQ